MEFSPLRTTSTSSSHCDMRRHGQSVRTREVLAVSFTAACLFAFGAPSCYVVGNEKKYYCCRSGDIPSPGVPSIHDHRVLQLLRAKYAHGQM